MKGYCGWMEEKIAGFLLPTSKLKILLRDRRTWQIMIPFVIMGDFVRNYAVLLNRFQLAT
jgi:hypothetical protein